MKLNKERLLLEPDKFFIVFHANRSFSRWHNHPEFELVLTSKGNGKRIVGDHIDRFYDNDLVLLGPYLPHEWHCDAEYEIHPDGFQGEAIVYQFLPDFLGHQFFEMHENQNLKRLLGQASRGIELYGKTKEKIIRLMVQNYNKDDIDKLYSLLSIFKLLSKTEEYNLLASPGFMEPAYSDGNAMIQKALSYMLQNFQREITLKELLGVTSMGITSFSSAFRKIFRMSAKEYLIFIRIGYACKLLTEGSQTISEVAYNSGFQNISNFNRHFKKLKGITPSQFQDKLTSGRLDSE